MKLPEGTEILIVGAGLAGSTLAIDLARQGRDVLLIEKDKFPRNKVCGEFLSMEVVDCLTRMGALERFFALKPATMTRSRFTVQGGKEIELDLPGKAYGLSRKRLDLFLFEEARRAGAKTVDAVEVKEVRKEGSNAFTVEIEGKEEKRRQVVRAQVVIGAYGRRSSLDRRLNRPFFENRSPYVAFKRHFRIGADLRGERELKDFVELHTFKGGYCGVSYVEDEIVNVCTLFDRREVSFSLQEGIEGLKKSSSALARRLESLVPLDEEELTIAQVPLGLKESGPEEILFVGDAAAMIAPLAGDGQAMAIEGALLLGALFEAEGLQVSQEHWERVWRKEYAWRIRLGQGLQKTLIMPGLTRGAMAIVDTFPQAGKRLIQWTRSAGKSARTEYL